MKRTTVACLMLLMGSSAVAQDALDGLDQAFSAIEPKVIAWRRDIHQHPELSNREFRTAALVAEHLRQLGIDDVETGIAHTGVVGTLVGGKPGPVIALRADMDGLPVREQTGLPFASTQTAEYNGEGSVAGPPMYASRIVFAIAVGIPVMLFVSTTTPRFSCGTIIVRENMPS